MELLSLCSHVLYNEELLFMKKRLNAYKKREYLHTIPQVQYENLQEWREMSNAFRSTIKHYIMNKPFAESDVLRKSFNTKSQWLCGLQVLYKKELSRLMKGGHQEWCESETQKLVNNIICGFCGLKKILSNGWGSFPFTHWRVKEYRSFVLGIIDKFEKNRELLQRIPYFQCKFCNNIFNPRIREILGYRDNLCICLDNHEKMSKCVIQIQRIWRGFRIRNLNI